MIELDKKQAKLLKMINKKTFIDYPTLDDEEMDICSHLNSFNYVEFSTVTHIPEGYDFPMVITTNDKVYITQQGKAALYSRFVGKFRFTVPNIINTILSIVAIIISIFALLKPW